MNFKERLIKTHHWVRISEYLC